MNFYRHLKATSELFSQIRNLHAVHNRAVTTRQVVRACLRAVRYESTSGETRYERRHLARALAARDWRMRNV